MEDKTPTPTINNIDLLASLQRTLNKQSAAARENHNLILIDADLVDAAIQALRSVTLQTFATLQNYLRDGQSLTPIEYDILALLIAAGGNAVPYSEINQRAGIMSGTHNDHMESLWVHKCRLMSKLRPEFELVTVRKRGYALKAV